MNIADRIQHLRKTKGITQEEFADRIGVSRQAVSKWESEQSIPDLDKIIVMSDFFDVTTDYILKGIETEDKTNIRTVNANIYVTVSTVLNFIGLIVSSAVWYEEQVPMALVIGLIFMALSCMVLGVGFAGPTFNKDRAKQTFWTINIWMLSFIPLSCIYNVLSSHTMAPYPLPRQPLSAFLVFWIVYIAICLCVVFIQLKKKTGPGMDGRFS